MNSCRVYLYALPALTAAITLPAIAHAAAMNADSFYDRAVVLEKKGMAAMFSKDLKPLMNEMKAAGAAVKAENEAAKKAGKPLYCPPAKGGKMDAKQVIAAFGAIPENRRKAMTVKAAWKEIIVKKFPC